MPGDARETGRDDAVDLVVVVALREESRAIGVSLARRRGGRIGSLRCEEGTLGDRHVLVVRTGIGRANARRKTAELLALVRPRALLATGFAGGLAEELRSGDIVVASEVAAGAGSAADAPCWTLRAELASGCREALAGAAPERGVFAGRLVTVDEVLAGAAAKRALHATSHAIAVDMESSAVVEEAERRGVPAGCARVVLDEASYELPFDFGRILTSEGRIRPLRAAASVAARPGRLLALPELRRRAEIASAGLTALLPAALAWLLGERESGR